VGEKVKPSENEALVKSSQLVSVIAESSAWAIGITSAKTIAGSIVDNSFFIVSPIQNSVHTEAPQPHSLLSAKLPSGKNDSSSQNAITARCHRIVCCEHPRFWVVPSNKAVDA
jgi:hypothetical protein